MPGTELFGAEERKEVNDVLETGILFRYKHDAQRNNHWKAIDFENEVKKITGAKYAHAMSSGSTAIATALAASGIGTGDEVIVPPFTFIATIEAVLFVGALPVFAEVDETLCLSAEGIKKAITPKTKGICLVHMCGGMADMDALMKVVNEHKLILVEVQDKHSLLLIKELTQDYLVKQVLTLSISLKLLLQVKVVFK